MKFRTPHDDPAEHKAESDRTGLTCTDPSLTVQSESLDTDINEIVRRYGITGKLPENTRIPTYGDFSGITDFASAVAAVEAAETEFMKIPGEQRAIFQNSPQAFLEFASNPDNHQQLLEMGFGKEVLPKPEVTPPAPPTETKVST